jgi:hypothetical protein
MGFMSQKILSSLGVVVDDGQVYKLSPIGTKGKALGPLVGAEAGVTDGTSRRTLTRTMTGVGAFTKQHKAVAYVVTGNGELQERKLDGAGQVRKAQAEAVKFNALVKKKGLADSNYLPDNPAGDAK